jgi:hypothetical protein
MPINKDKAKAIEKEEKKELGKIKKEALGAKPPMKDILVEAPATPLPKR